MYIVLPISFSRLIKYLYSCPLNLQVQGAKDQNPLALPWFTGKHASPCAKCEDLWKVAWSAREDLLRDLFKAETGKGYQLVASSGEHLRCLHVICCMWGA